MGGMLLFLSVAISSMPETIHLLARKGLFGHGAGFSWRDGQLVFGPAGGGIGHHSRMSEQLHVR
jgi:hypothetical protein